MWAWLPASEEPPSATAAMAALTERFGPGLSMEMVSPPVAPRATWELSCALPHGGRRFSVWAMHSQQVESLHLQHDHQVLSAAEKEALSESAWSLGVALVFGDTPLDDFHFQLRALLAVAPSAVAAFDVAAFRLHHREWIKESAQSAAPPAPTSLFVMHFVCDGGKPGWIHTHGLDRCGRLELELFDITPDASRLLSELVNSAAAFFLEQGLPAPGDPVEVGRELSVLWLPWEEALARKRPRYGGGQGDRDEGHGNPTADPSQYGTREHIWFEVHSFGAEHVDATCINQPHSVPALREGQRGLHQLSLISDWTIFCPVGRFDAERVGVLVHVLDSAPAELRAQLGL